MMDEPQLQHYVDRLQVRMQLPDSIRMDTFIEMLRISTSVRKLRSDFGWGPQTSLVSSVAVILPGRVKTDCR